MLEHVGIAMPGMDAVVVGASNIVGRPMALELLLAGATTTVCHTRTRDLAAHVARAELLVVATGRPQIVPGEWIRPGAVVIDVGINRLPDGKFVGDVAFEAAAQRAAWITPVPGGVGPMTVAMLMHNARGARDLKSAAEVQGRGRHRVPLHRITVLRIRRQQFVALQTLEETRIERQVPMRQQIAPLYAGAVIIALRRCRGRIACKAEEAAQRQVSVQAIAIIEHAQRDHGAVEIIQLGAHAQIRVLGDGATHAEAQVRGDRVPILQRRGFLRGRKAAQIEPEAAPAHAKIDKSFQSQPRRLIVIVRAVPVLLIAVLARFESIRIAAIEAHECGEAHEVAVE